MRLKDRFDRTKRKPSTRRQRIGFALFWLLLVAFAYFIPTGPNWNTESHLYPAYSLVDHHTIDIDRYHLGLGDEAYVHGHYYGDKAPGLSLLAVPVYAGLHLVLPNYKGHGYLAFSQMKFAIRGDTVYLRYAITYVLVILPSAVFAVLFWLFLARLTGSEAWSLAAVVVYALGTISYVYSRQFFSHQISAILLFSAFMLLFAHIRQKVPERNLFLKAVLAGLLAGYAVICEYPTFLIAGLLGVYVLVIARRRLRTGLAYLIGMLPSALVGMAYNMIAFRSPFSAGYAYEKLTVYRSHVHTGLVASLNPLSYGVQPPSLDSLWQITFGAYRGIFLISPVLLLFFAGLFFMWRRRDLRPEFWLCLGIVLLYFLLDASRDVTLNGWSGGSSVASRHLTPMLPFMILPIAFGLANKIFQVSFAVLGVASICITLMTGATSEAFNYLDHNPLVNEMLPRFFGGKFMFSYGSLLGLNGIPSGLPLLVLELAIIIRLVWLFQRGPTEAAQPRLSLLELQAS